MKSYLYSISFIFLLNCIGQEKTPSETKYKELNNTIDLTIGFKNIQSVLLSEIADSVTFLLFETTPQSYQREGQKHIRFSSSYIFYYNMCFDWTGNYCGTIIKSGQGPYEEPEGGTLVYNNDHFYSRGSKLIEYDHTGKPTGKVRNLYTSNDFKSSDFLRRGIDFSSAGENFIIYDFPTTLYFINKNFTTISSRTVFQTDDSLPSYIPPIGDSKCITYYKDKILFYNFMNDTIFYITDTDLKPQWIVKFNEQLRLPTQAMLNSNQLMSKLRISPHNSGLLENAELIKLTDNKHKIISAHETDKYIFFQMTEIILFAIPRGKQPPDPYIIYYNKETGKATRVKGNGFVDDLLGMDFFYPQLGVFDEKLITFIWPFELLNYIEDCRNIGREINPQLLALSKQVKENDNPVLILVHLKK